MHTSKVEVALWRHICNICCNPALLAKLPDLCGRLWIVDGGHDHICTIKVGWLEFAIDIFNLTLLDPVCDFRIQPFSR